MLSAIALEKLIGGASIFFSSLAESFAAVMAFAGSALLKLNRFCQKDCAIKLMIS